jgi:hypothetical protein
MSLIMELFEKLMLKKRWHLFEFDDQSWLPNTLRQLYMNILGSNKFRVRPFKRRLIEDLQNEKIRIIHSLCSGNGNFVFLLYTLLQEQKAIKFILSDLFPLTSEYKRLKSLTNGDIDFIDSPVDATKIQPTFGEWFLMAGSLHHFRENDLELIFQMVIDNKGTLIMMENHNRTYAQALKLLLVLPIFTVFVSIFSKPFRLIRLVFGVILPVVPMMILVDGIISNFRSYKKVDLDSILYKLSNANGYVINADPIRYGAIFTGMYFILFYDN